jgi:hypothetical protein
MGRGLIECFTIALARGARTGVRITRRPSERDTASNDPAKSAPRSRRRNFPPDRTSPIVIARLRAR